MSASVKRRESLYDRAVALVLEEGMTLSAAARVVRNGVTVSTLHRRVKVVQRGSAGVQKKNGRPCALSVAQERSISQLCLKYASRGVPITKDELALLVQDIFGSSTSLAYRFKNGKPGRYWIEGFCKRNNLSFKKPRRQAAERYAATSPEVLTTHLVSPERIYEDLNVDTERLFNLDETGATPGKDCNGSSGKKGIMANGTRCDRKGTEFNLNLNRVTLMACISASGETVLPFWIFKGKQLPFRMARNVDGSVTKETVASVLPAGSLLATREDTPGINPELFIRWCGEFVKRISYLTTNGRKDLLIYDGYRSHMPSKALRVLSAGNVEAYALPAHTSGTTQPLDVSVFSPFKRYINEHLYRTITSVRHNGSPKICYFELCKAFTSAYNLAFSRASIASGFEKTGTWPLNPSKLLFRPLPKCADNITEIVPVEMISNLPEQKRGSRSDSTEVSFKRGWIDTTSGELLTSPAAMQAVHEKETELFKKKLTRSAKAAQAALRVQRSAEDGQRRRMAAEKVVLKWRARRYNLDVAKLRVLRSILERRAIARARVESKKLSMVDGGYPASDF